MNSGVSISYNYQAFYWGNFRSVLSRSYDDKDALIGRDTVAVSYSESFIVLRGE